MYQLYYNAYLLWFLVFLINILLINSVNQIWRPPDWNSKWDAWWHYKAGEIGGPQHWGHSMLTSHENVWMSCRKGHNQSPINITLDKLLYDPTLTPISVKGDHNSIQLSINNMGQDLVITQTSKEDIIISGGPLSYAFKFFNLLIKFGSISTRGSDHQINGINFPGELQFYAFNNEIYDNISDALNKPYGLAAISVLLKIGKSSTDDLKALIQTAEKCVMKGSRRLLNGLQLHRLMPNMDQYITYPGSLPFPACDETVTWIILNQHLDVTESQLKSLRQLKLYKSENSGRMADNFRPIQSLHNRAIRTNIKLHQQTNICDFKQEFYYEVNTNFP